MDVQLPDGTIVKDVPEGTTKAQLAQRLKAGGMAVPAEWLAPAPAPASLAQRAGILIKDELPRQAGLTMRAGLQGLVALPGMASDAITGIYNTGADAVQGKGQGFRFQPAGYALGNLMTKAGVPEPADANERVIQDAAQTVAGAAGLISATKKAAEVTGGVTRNVLQSMAAKPAVQLTGAATAGASGGSVREAGGGPVEQFLASLAGGVAGGLAANRAPEVGNALVNMAQKGVRTVAPGLGEATRNRMADVQIQLALNRSGMDWSAMPERIRQSIRAEVADAIGNGRELNADALRRLVVFQRTGTQPTVGQLTQDPGQITREMNLAKVGANSTDQSLQRLPALQNQNTARLLSNLDDMGAMQAAEPIDVSRAALGDMTRFDARMQSFFGDLYNTARDSSGRSLQLNHGFVNQRANQLLDDANVGSFLPADIRNKLNAMADAKPGFELRIDAAEQLKTSLGKIARATNDGNVAAAVKLVRQALDEAPLADSVRSNPGNLPAVAGTVPPSTAPAGQAALDAFSKARREYAAHMARVERTPALKAAIDKVQPDQFMDKFVTGKSASVADVRAMREVISDESAAAIRQALAKQLRDAATNSTDDITKFSNDAYRRALRNIGEEKLRVFFADDELQMLRDIGAAAKYMQAQPTGSAVNNSNSGALVLGRAFDLFEQIAGRVPVIGRDLIQGSIQGLQQTASLKPSNALANAAGARQPMPKVNPLIAAAAVTPAQGRENERRK